MCRTRAGSGWVSTRGALPSNRERMPVRHRIPFELTGSEVPAATLVDELVPVGSSGAQSRGAIPGDRVKQCHATLSRVDAVDADFVIDGDQPPVAAVESLPQIGELRTVAGEARTRVTE